MGRVWLPPHVRRLRDLLTVARVRSRYGHHQPSRRVLRPRSEISPWAAQLPVARRRKPGPPANGAPASAHCGARGRDLENYRPAGTRASFDEPGRLRTRPSREWSFEPQRSRPPRTEASTSPAVRVIAFALEPLRACQRISRPSARPAHGLSGHRIDGDAAIASSGPTGNAHPRHEAPGPRPLREDGEPASSCSERQGLRPDRFRLLACGTSPIRVRDRWWRYFSGVLRCLAGWGREYGLNLAGYLRGGREARHVDRCVGVEAFGNAVPSAHSKLDELRMGKNPEPARRDRLGN